MENASSEKILTVEEVKNHPKQEDDPWGFEEQGDGYRVVTDRRELLFLIDNREQCCEKWGHLASEDDLASFAGAHLLKVRLTDPQLKSIDVSNPEGEEFVNERDVTFITLHTDRGPLQFCAYTEHNGYYGHAVWFKDGSTAWRDVTEEED